MGLITNISLKNLVRQKRRNLLLGIAIAFGVMILVVAHSFSAGITDILLNKIVARIAGHMQVAFNEKGRINRMIFRDKERIIPIIKNHVENIHEIEESLGVFSRVIGNGKADNLILVGIDLSQTLSEETKKEIKESFKMLVGEFSDLSDKTQENPVIISEEKAKMLNVKKNDVLRMRYKNVLGNDETARVTVIGIMKNDNIFMQGVMFSLIEHVKRLMGYRPYETANLSITIKDPRKNAVKMAEKLHAVLKPGLAVISGKINSEPVTMLGYKTNEDGKKIVGQNIELLSGEKDKVFVKEAVLINETLAQKLGINIGDAFEISYKNKFDNKNTQIKYKLSGIFRNPEMKSYNVVFVNEEKFYDTYLNNLPEEIKADKDIFIPELYNPLYKAFSTEWDLLDRTTNTDDLKKKLKDIGQKKWKGTTVDVRTMYESASDVLKLENVLNIITITAGLILFFIILIGVINTLRMTIRERTREIGTIRAIGMQKSDVRNSFILESFFLALFASVIGVVMALGVMKILTEITFHPHDNPLSILLVNGHLYFKTTFIGILINVLLILAIVIVTAFFPARRAANLPPGAALRHYE